MLVKILVMSCLILIVSQVLFRYLIKKQESICLEKKSLIEDLANKIGGYDLYSKRYSFKDYAPYYEHLPDSWKGSLFESCKNYFASKATSTLVHNDIKYRDAEFVTIYCPMKIISYLENESGIVFLLQDPYGMISTNNMPNYTVSMADKILNQIVFVQAILSQGINYVEVISIDRIDLKEATRDY